MITGSKVCQPPPRHSTPTDSPQQVAENTNAMVMVSVVEQLAVEKNKLALQLRDLKTLNLADANHLDEDCWLKQRKSMRQEQFRLSYQQNRSE